jgi:hypothetical protein
MLLLRLLLRCPVLLAVLVHAFPGTQRRPGIRLASCS